MKTRNNQVQLMTTERFRALFIVLIVLVMLFIPLLYRHLTVHKRDFPRANRYLDTARFYHSQKSEDQALDAVNIAIKLYDQPLVWGNGRLAEALLLKAEIEKN